MQLCVFVLILISVPCSNENAVFDTLVDLPHQQTLNVIRDLFALGRWAVASSTIKQSPIKAASPQCAETTTTNILFPEGIMLFDGSGYQFKKASTPTTCGNMTYQYIPCCYYYLAGAVGLLCCRITSLCIATTICPWSPWRRRLRLPRSCFLSVSGTSLTAYVVQSRWIRMKHFASLSE